MRRMTQDEREAIQIVQRLMHSWGSPCCSHAYVAVEYIKHIRRSRFERAMAVLQSVGIAAEFDYTYYRIYLLDEEGERHASTDWI